MGTVSRNKTNAAQLAANSRYKSAHIEQIGVEVRKGRKAEYKQQAKLRGIGLMELFRRGADEYIQNHPPIVDSEKPAE